MTLKTYMKRYKYTLKEMEEKTGIDFRTLSLYSRKLVTPSVKNAKIIKQVTNGKVKLEDWYVPSSNTRH